ncbi:MAG TPA: hypothetical protein VIU87_27150, partial [Mycobacterium sp.]
MRVDRAAVGEPHGPRRAVHLDADDVPGGDHLGTELEGLPPRPLGELRSGDAVREAEIVLDPGALAGLTAGGRAFDEHGPQALRSPVDGGAETRRPRADHHDVVEILG